MKKWFLILLSLAMVGLLLTASAEAPLTNQNIGENIEEFSAEDSDPLKTIPIVGQVVDVVEEIDLDAEDGDVIVEDVDLDEEEDEEEELEWLTEEDEAESVEPEEIIEWYDLDADEVYLPTVFGEVTEDTFELSKPEEGAPIVGGHYKGELLHVADISGDYWMLGSHTYISADAIKIYNEDDIPGDAEARTIMNPRFPFDVKMVLCDPASEIEDIVEKYHSVIIVDPYEKLIHCYKLGINTLDVRYEPLNELSPLYAYWTVEEDFLQEGEYLIGWEEVLAKIYAYTLPGSYLVIFQ